MKLVVLPILANFLRVCRFLTKSDTPIDTLELPGAVLQNARKRALNRSCGVFLSRESNIYLHFNHCAFFSEVLRSLGAFLRTWLSGAPMVRVATSVCNGYHELQRRLAIGREAVIGRYLSPGLNRARTHPTEKEADPGFLRRAGLLETASC